jgi:hypothetical protein
VSSLDISPLLTVGFDQLLLAQRPSLEGLLSQVTNFLEEALFGLISFSGIASSILDDIKKSIKFSLEFRVALETSKKL